MKLIGIEFEDYASFDKQFVRLGKPINIIVGRNNAGKTAFLRGISLINVLAANGRPIAGNPSQYARKRDGELVRFFFELDGAFAASLRWSDESIRAFIDGQALVWFEFSHHPGGAMFLGTCGLFFNGQMLPFSGLSGQAYMLGILTPNGGLQFQNPLTAGVASSVSRGGTAYVSPVPDVVQRVFVKLHPVVMVEPHRTI